MSDEDDSTPDVMNKFQSFILNTKRIFAISTKPTKKEYMQTFKICSVALLMVGLISFIIKVIASIVQEAPAANTTTTTT